MPKAISLDAERDILTPTGIRPKRGIIAKLIIPMARTTSIRENPSLPDSLPAMKWKQHPCWDVFKAIPFELVHFLDMLEGDGDCIGSFGS